MPIKAEIDGTVIEFPDGTTPEEMTKAVNTHFKDQAPAAISKSQVDALTPERRKMYDELEGMKGQLEKAVPEDQLQEMQRVTSSPWQMAVTPITHAFPKPVQQAVRSGIKTALTGPAAPVVAMLPQSVKDKILPPTTLPGKVLRGTQEGVADVAESFVSPLGLVTAGTGTLVARAPKAIQATLGAAFALQGVAQGSQAYKDMVEAAKKGDWGTAARAATMLVGSGVQTLAGGHSFVKGTMGQVNAIRGIPESAKVLPRARAEAIRTIQQEAARRGAAARAAAQAPAAPVEAVPGKPATVTPGAPPETTAVQPAPGNPQPVQPAPAPAETPRQTIRESDLSDEHKDLLEQEAAAGNHEVVVAGGPIDENNPFAGKIATIDRKTGHIVINPQELSSWLQNRGKGGVPEGQERAAVRSLLGEEKIHLATDDASAKLFHDSATPAERAIAQRVYAGPGAKALDPTMLGHEMLRQRMQKLARMSVRETIEASTSERWKVKSLLAVSDAIRKVRETIGTKASKEQTAILNRVQNNLDAAMAHAQGQSPAAIQKQFGEQDTEEQQPSAGMTRARAIASGEALKTGFTNEAMKAGAGLDPSNPRELQELRDNEAKYAAEFQKVKADKALTLEERVQKMQDAGLRKQWFTEAIQAATGKVSSKDVARQILGDYKPPFPEGEPVPAATRKFKGEEKTPNFFLPPINEGEARPTAAEAGALPAQKIPPEQALKTDTVLWNKPNAWRRVTNENLHKPYTLGKQLTEGSRANEGDPVSLTRRLVALEKDGKVHVVSIYPDAEDGARAVDPVYARNNYKRPNVPLKALLDEGYKPIVSMLRHDPVQNFHREFDSVQQFENTVGQPGDQQWANVQGYEAQTAATEAPSLGKGRPMESQDADTLYRHFSKHETSEAAIDAIASNPKRNQIRAALEAAIDRIMADNPRVTRNTAAELALQKLYETAKASPTRADFVQNAVQTFGEQTPQSTGQLAKGGTERAPEISGARDLLMQPRKPIRTGRILYRMPAQPGPVQIPNLEAIRAQTEAKYPLTKPMYSELAKRQVPEAKYTAPKTEAAKFESTKEEAKPTAKVQQPPTTEIQQKLFHRDFWRKLEEERADKAEEREVEEAPTPEEILDPEEVGTGSHEIPGEPTDDETPGAMRKFQQEAKEQIALTEEDIRNFVTQKGVEKDIVNAYQNAQNAPNNMAQREEMGVRMQSIERPKGVVKRLATQWTKGNKDVLAAANAMVQALAVDKNGNISTAAKSNLRLFKQQVATGMAEAQRWINSGNMRQARMGKAWMRSQVELMKELDYADAHWFDQDLRATAGRMKKALDEQWSRERATGHEVSKDLNYVPQRYAAAIWNEHSMLFDAIAGTEKILGGRFRKPKTFKTYYEASANGPYIPVTRDGASLVGHRVRQGMNMIERDAWADGLKATTMSNGDPVAIDARRNRSGGLQPPAHRDYTNILLGTKEMAIHDDYLSLVKNLTESSKFEDWPVAKGILRFEQQLKHGMLIGDFFHLGRMLYYSASIMGRNAGWKGGWSTLDIKPGDIPEAVRRGVISQEEADWGNGTVRYGNRNITRRELSDIFVKHGANLGKIQDALYKDLITELTPAASPLRKGIQRVVDPSVGRYNRFLFDKLTRGLMAESNIREFERQSKANPNLDHETLVKDIAKDVNNYYGNIGKQGWMKSATQKDLARLLFLAPDWVEGLVKKEAGFYGRATGAAKVAGLRKGVTNLGTTGRGIGRGLVFLLGLTQAINLITRRQPTWNNEEKGHKMDAWIPGFGKDNEGYWFSPLSLFNELTHDAWRYAQGNHTVMNALDTIVGNKESPLTHAALIAGVGATAPGGQRATSSMAQLKSAASQMAPVPITFGKLGQLAGHAVAPKVIPPVSQQSLWRQAYASLGSKLEPKASAELEVSRNAQQFAKENGFQKETGWVQQETDEPSYSKLRYALRIGDESGAKSQLEQLRKNHTDKAIFKAMKLWKSRPFTGSKQGESAFIRSLSDRELQTYYKALEQKDREYEQWVDFALREQ